MNIPVNCPNCNSILKFNYYHHSAIESKTCDATPNHIIKFFISNDRVAQIAVQIKLGTFARWHLSTKLISVTNSVNNDLKIISSKTLYTIPWFEPNLKSIPNLINTVQLYTLLM
jgi:hypothetical protein